MPARQLAIGAGISFPGTPYLFAKSGNKYGVPGQTSGDHTMCGAQDSSKHLQAPQSKAMYSQCQKLMGASHQMKQKTNPLLGSTNL